MATKKSDEWEDAPASALNDGWEDAPHEGFLTKAAGVGEAGLNFVSGIPAALGGGLTYLGSLAATQDPDAALHVKEDTEKAINGKIQYEPRLDSGKRYEKNLGEGFQKAINMGGPSLDGVIRSIPFVGDNLADDNKGAIDAAGKAYAEMALNVADPLIAIKGVKKFMGKEKPLDMSHADKIEPKLEDKGWEDAPATTAHADDFAAMNPYDVGGHVSELMQGRESTIDNAQGDLFGSHTLEEAQHVPDLGQASIRHDTIPYEKTFPFDLVPKDEPTAQTQMGLNMPEKDSTLSTTPDPTTHNTWEQGQVGSRDAARAKEAEQAAWEAHVEQERTKIEQEKEAAQSRAEYEAAARKEADLNRMEAQRELDFADEAERVQNSPARNFFTDPKNRDKLDLQDADIFLKRATDEHLARLYADTYRQWADSGHKDTSAEKLMDTINKEQVRRSIENLRAENKDKVNEVHPGYPRIPEGTIVEYEYKGEIHRAPVEKNTTVKTAYGTTHIPRVWSPDGRLIALDKEQIKTVYGKPKSVEIDHQFNEGIVGDKTMMQPEHTSAMVDSLAKGDVHGALDTIAKNHENVEYRNLADYLKSVLDGIKVKVHDEGILEIGDRHATGYFDPESRTVGLSRVGATSPHTVLHELVHAVTSHFVNTRPNDLRVMGLKDLFNKLSEMGMDKEFPEVTNVKEMLAEAFSSPEFQDFLKEHRIQSRSTWRRFMDNVKSMLGFSSADRSHITNALEHVMDLGKQIAGADKDGTSEVLKDAGIPGKLADLMVVRNKPTPSVHPDVRNLNIPGLRDAISDFKFDDRPMGEIVKEAQESADIPNTMLEKLAQQLQAGGLFESLKTRNPVVKATYERITRASQEYAHDIKKYLTDPETGIKAYMRALTPDEKGQIHSAMILHEGVKELSNLELRNMGMNDKQIAYYQKMREQDKRFLNDINERRKELGMEPIDERVAHMAGRFMGDFSRFIFDADGKKIVGRISGNTRAELNRAMKYMQDKHPEYQMGKEEYNHLGQGKNPGDRFQGLMEALNFLTKSDADVAGVMESYRGYLQKDAIGYLNAVRHAKAKVREPGGIKGSEGNKPWLDTVKNAEEGMKAQLAYYEQGYKWMAMEKAVHDLKPLLGDEKVNLNTPNAVEWANKYVAHALGKQGQLANAVNWTASVMGEFTGMGHSNFFKLNNQVKHVMMQKFMGLMNIPFSVTQMMQPFQVHPPMLALLKSRGMDINPITAQMKAARTHLEMLKEQHGMSANYDAFQKAAVEYADRAGIVDVKMADHTKDINESKALELYNKVADFNIELPEKLTRGTSFFFYAHLLKDSGVPIKDALSAAENLTNMTMVNYHPIERPMGYAQLGWLGDLASTLTRYKHNQFSQAAFYTREGIRQGDIKSMTPLATFLATSLAFGGVMGFFGYNEADTAYQLASQFLGKPDTLTNVLFKHNTPELISHGLFSTLGLDMTTRFSNANVVPDSIGQALMPYGSAVLNMLDSTYNVAKDPTSSTRWKQFGKAVAPQSVQGLMENTMFTDKQPDGRNLYMNSTDGPNLGKGRVYRSDGDMGLRAFGFRDIKESKELAKNYSDSQINKAKGDLAKGVLDQAKYAAMDGKLTPVMLGELARKAATQYDMDPGQFAQQLASWEGARHMSQAEQIKFRNALGGFTGAMRANEGR